MDAHMEDSKKLECIESALGVKNQSGQSVSRDEIQAAYALNLCAVSVSQIIDYNDINILEQEYEMILNNLNLENFPKDEALLSILKRILETISFFRIQEGEKEFVEKEYKQKMKSAIWNAMPNPGALIQTGLSRGIVGMSLSLAATVGTGYMNYRKNKAEYQLNREKQEWELKKTAMEQFQALQQQLFETSWRLADKYKFPDAFRLSEKQIGQYNNILMDTDEIRKYERMDSIKHKFAAYPPFWYYFGNTADSISRSDHYGLDQADKDIYRNFAVNCFEYYSQINKYNLLREDSISASCYLEYIDLLDAQKDSAKIEELLQRAVETAGNSLDILQLCVFAYMKIDKIDQAAAILRILINEQYNEVTNAQLLSTIYVSKYIEMQSKDAKAAYKLLAARVPSEYLFPMPQRIDKNEAELGREFIKKQQDILIKKYNLVMREFVHKYEAKINSIIPLPSAGAEYPASAEIYAEKESLKEERIKRVSLVLSDNDNKGYLFKSRISGISYSYEILDILNKMFGSICVLDFMQIQQKQEELQNIIAQQIKNKKDTIEEINRSLPDFNIELYKKIQDNSLEELTGNFFECIVDEIKLSTVNKREMQDFAIAEYSLMQFCDKEEIENPEVLFEHKDDVVAKAISSTYFTPDLLGNSAIKANDRIEKNKKMVDTIQNSINAIVAGNDKIEFYTQEDPKMNRYFSDRSLQKDKDIRCKTLAVLDDRSRADMDLIFTTEGIMPVIKGRVKKPIAYSKIEWSANNKKKTLKFSVNYSNENIDMDKLHELIMKLKVNEASIEDTKLYLN